MHHTHVGLSALAARPAEDGLQVETLALALLVVDRDALGR